LWIVFTTIHKESLDGRELNRGECGEARRSSGLESKATEDEGTLCNFRFYHRFQNQFWFNGGTPLNHI
jgi:hypothetical protein